MNRLAAIFIIIVMVLSLSPTAFADEAEQETETFYASAEFRGKMKALTESEGFYDYAFFISYLEKSEEIVVDINSIAPVYGVRCESEYFTDDLNILKDGEFACWGRNPNVGRLEPRDETTLYMAKLVTLDRQCAGYIVFTWDDAWLDFNWQEECSKSYSEWAPYFYPQNEYLTPLGMEICEDEPRPRLAEHASFSYADHAERIKNILGRDTIVPAEDVRLVALTIYELYFHILSEDVFIPVGYMLNEENKEFAVDVVMTRDEFIARRDINTERFDVYPSNYVPLEAVCSSVNDIANIPEYLGIEMEVIPYVPESENGFSIKTVITVCAACALCAIAVSAVVTVVVMSKKKKAE